MHSEGGDPRIDSEGRLALNLYVKPGSWIIVAENPPDDVPFHVLNDGRTHWDIFTVGRHDTDLPCPPAHDATRGQSYNYRLFTGNGTRLVSRQQGLHVPLMTGVGGEGCIAQVYPPGAGPSGRYNLSPSPLLTPAAAAAAAALSPTAVTLPYILQNEYKPSKNQRWSCVMCGTHTTTQRRRGPDKKAGSVCNKCGLQWRREQEQSNEWTNQTPTAYAASYSTAPLST